ncbi:unnamed protein product [Angiostrongylus costaricensis]|uniref:LisH domain-containing protein n=1 Tax=Angiostrongylus costaricensis TaxID=334426 RepID=A0A0R3PUX3_ANGCS|nr:unnamed protein product [Angiostrongylus costaricensis]
MRTWFQKFKSGDFNLEDKERRGRPSELDDDELKAVVETNTRTLILLICITSSTVEDSDTIIRLCRNSMTFSSSELNYLILKYLQESGLEHSAFVFGNESELNRSDLMGVEVPSGALVSIVQRGLYYIEAEVSVFNGQMDTAYKNKTGTLPLIDGGFNTQDLDIIKK